MEYKISTINDCEAKLSLNDKFLLKDLGEQPTRKIFILTNNVYNVSGKNYLNLTGIDIYSGAIVKIVDTNGVKAGYHTFKVDISKIKPNSMDTMNLMTI